MPMRRYFLSISMVMMVSLWAFSSQAHAQRTGAFGSITQAHHFDVPPEELEPADAVLLFGVFPAVGIANAVVLTGNIVAMARGKHQRTWGGAGIIVGALTALGSPLIADQGVAWMALPLGVAGAVLALSIANLVLHGRKPAQKAKPMEMRPSGKTGGSLVPLVAATQ